MGRVGQAAVQHVPAYLGRDISYLHSGCSPRSAGMRVWESVLYHAISQERDPASQLAKATQPSRLDFVWQGPPLVMDLRWTQIHPDGVISALLAPVFLFVKWENGTIYPGSLPR